MAGVPGVLGALAQLHAALESGHGLDLALVWVPTAKDQMQRVEPVIVESVSFAFKS